ncbi:hypothetical protein SAMN05444358_1163 [Ruegeria halocynthiae]|uniref:Uncharacterized protein n=1 Tax=Ruegeria halocynthiae TaxID=985054 RepID=A0A1H3FMV2_9RHOB|nr:hypothetical protein SAMN05444358_1163 [Ruegeria halocynthiae]
MHEIQKLNFIPSPFQTFEQSRIWGGRFLRVDLHTLRDIGPLRPFANQREDTDFWYRERAHCDGFVTFDGCYQSNRGNDPAVFGIGEVDYSAHIDICPLRHDDWYRTINFC